MKPVGYGQQWRWLMPHRGFILAEAVPARVSLYNAVRPGPDRPALLSNRRKRQIIPAIARLVRRLHDAKLCWPDLVAKHILFNPPSDDDADPQWNLHLIDLERMCREEYFRRIAL